MWACCYHNHWQEGATIKLGHVQTSGLSQFVVSSFVLFSYLLIRLASMPMRHESATFSHCWTAWHTEIRLRRRQAEQESFRRQNASTKAVAHNWCLWMAALLLRQWHWGQHYCLLAEPCQCCAEGPTTKRTKGETIEGGRGTPEVRREADRTRQCIEGLYVSDYRERCMFNGWMDDMNSSKSFSSSQSGKKSSLLFYRYIHPTVEI